jgi:hypothetical protein
MTPTPPDEADCPDCGLPHPSRNPYCFCKKPTPPDDLAGLTDDERRLFELTMRIRQAAKDVAERQMQEMERK